MPVVIPPFPRAAADRLPISPKTTMHFPLTMTFRILALAPQVHVRDLQGTTVFFVRQKLMRLKEHVEVFADESRSRLLYDIHADRMIDFSATYRFTDAAGRSSGAVRRRGLRSLWRARYDLLDEQDRQCGTITEVNPLASFADQLLGNVPGVSFVTGFILHPVYSLADATGRELLRLTKQPAFFESRFLIDRCGPCTGTEELRGVLAFLMMTLLERKRG